MKSPAHTILCLVLGVFLLTRTLSATAQPPDKTAAILHHYAVHHAPEHLYLHLDKTTYMPEEWIWFTAYSLEAADSSRNTLFVTLQHIASDSILISARFVLEQHIAKGQLYLPPHLPEGDYRLLFYTNTQLTYPDKALCERWIHVLKTRDREWQLQQQNSSGAASSGFPPRFQLIKPDLSAAPGKKLHYRVRRGNEVLLAGTEKTSAAGEFVLPLPDSLQDKPLQLTADLEVPKEGIRYFSTPILPTKGLLVECYPESGSLLDGHNNKVAFEINGTVPVPENIEGAVWENGKPVTSLHFTTGRSGSFQLTPKYGATYTIHLNTDLNYKTHFPEIRKEGYALHIENSTAQDSLQLKVYAWERNNDLYVVVHNFRDILYSSGIRFAAKEGRMTIPLQDLAPGVVAVTLMNLQGLPLAERCIYIPPVQQDEVTIATDSLNYQSRSEVKIKVKITDNKGQPVKGCFSLAAVSSSLYDSLLAPSFRDYYYAGRRLPKATALPSLSALDKENRDVILLTRFWTRFTWQDTEARHNPPSDIAQGIKGTILYEGKPPKIPLDYLTAADKLVHLHYTDSSGNFSLSYADIAGPYGSLLYLSPVERKKYSYIQGFQLRTNACELERLNYAVAAKAQTFPPSERSSRPVTDQGYRVYLDKVIQLQEVQITARRYADPIDVLKEQYRKVGDDIFLGDCRNDYICMFHFDNISHGVNIPWINCWHGTGLRPIDGEYYFYPGPAQKYRKPGLTKYIGCPDTTRGKFLELFQATWQGREFYSATPEMQAVPGFIPTTTLFWKHLVYTNAQGEAALSCFTNDISGRFIIHLQGFTDHGPISGKQYFYVNSAR